MTEPQSEANPDLVSEEEDFEGSAEGDLNASLSGKVLLDNADRSLSELHRWYKSGRIILDPEWQRNYVWDRGRASLNRFNLEWAQHALREVTQAA